MWGFLLCAESHYTSTVTNWKLRSKMSRIFLRIVENLFNAQQMKICIKNKLENSISFLLKFFIYFWSRGIEELFSVL